MRLAVGLMLASALSGGPKPALRLVWAQVAVLPPGTSGVQQNGIIIPGVGIPGVPGSGGVPFGAPGVPGTSIQNRGNDPTAVGGAPVGNGVGGGGVMSPSPMKVTGSAGKDVGCLATFSRTRLEVPSEGGIAEVSVTLKPADCAPFPKLTEPWLEQHSTRELHRFRVEPNVLHTAREVSFEVAGQKMTVRQAAAPGYRIAVSPGRIEFAVVQGKSKKQIFSAWSDQPGLVYSAAVAAPGDWLQVTRTSSKKGKDFFEVTVNSANLSATRREGVVRVAAAGAEPVSIPVVLDVFPK